MLFDPHVYDTKKKNMVSHLETFTATDDEEGLAIFAHLLPIGSGELITVAFYQMLCTVRFVVFFVCLLQSKKA